MSIKYMQRVWAVKELKGGALLLMLALADHANDAGECWPSQKHLAEKARLEERQVRRVIGVLVKEGHVAITERRADHGRKTKYQLFPGDATPYSASLIAAKKADKMSESERTKYPPDKMSTGHLAHGRADISDTIYSHVRSESPIEPSEGNGISPSPDVWAVALAELSASLSSGLAGKYLTGSRLEAAGDIDGVPFYRVVIAPEFAVGVTWLTTQTRHTIRGKLTSLLKRDVKIEIVAGSTERSERAPPTRKRADAVTSFGKCPRCKGDMEPIAIVDARNSRGRWVNAEFTVCVLCAYPVLRMVESGRWRIIIGSDGTATETLYPYPYEGRQGDQGGGYA